MAADLSVWESPPPSGSRDKVGQMLVIPCPRRGASDDVTVTSCVCTCVCVWVGDRRDSDVETRVDKRTASACGDVWMIGLTYLAFSSREI